MISRTWLILLSLVFLCIASVDGGYAQGCPAGDLQSSGSHRFRAVGESFVIHLSVPEGIAETPLAEPQSADPRSVNQTENESAAECQPVALDLRWSNGRRNGSIFNVTFLDSNERPIYSKQFSAFMSGTRHFSLLSFEQRGAMISVPSSVIVRAAAPFAFPASISYTVTRVGRTGSAVADTESTANGEAGRPRIENTERRGEVVRIRSAVRLIGSARVALVQIELKTMQPFPVRDTALSLRIGERVFVDELWGDHTGRKVSLSLTPEMFAELDDGAEIVAYFDKASREAWTFGKLNKSSLEK